jgi:hypothetical protein
MDTQTDADLAKLDASAAPADAATSTAEGWSCQRLAKL